MSTIAWPVSLPQCALRGVQRASQPNVIEFGTEVGEGKARLRSTMIIQRVTASVVLTEAQALIFEDFWNHDVAQGALSFTMNDPRRGTTHTWRIEGGYNLSEQGGKQVLTMTLKRIG